MSWDITSSCGNESNVHDGQPDLQVIHFIDSDFPIFEFNGIFAVCEQYYFPRVFLGS